MHIDRDALFPFLIYNNPVKYSENIKLYPITMSDIITFQLLSKSITVRKNSIFREKEIIKMPYLDFLIYCLYHKNIEKEYQIDGLSQYYIYAIQLLQLCCKDAKIKLNEHSHSLSINDEIITPEKFDDLRRIIIIQNDIDFDIDEFLNYDTEQNLLKAQKKLNKGNSANIEDYIDSLIIAMNTDEKRIMGLTIRKFWRYIKRFQLYENYSILKTGECSGFVSFKEPVKYWMVSLEDTDKYDNLKTDENSLKGKISNANN